jgi:hypothetical protein
LGGNDLFPNFLQRSKAKQPLFELDPQSGSGYELGNRAQKKLSNISDHNAQVEGLFPFGVRRIRLQFDACRFSVNNVLRGTVLRHIASISVSFDVVVASMSQALSMGFFNLRSSLVIVV